VPFGSHSTYVLLPTPRYWETIGSMRREHGKQVRTTVTPPRRSVSIHGG
jgi:hypothetical protein